jgi:hypothetical protein
MFSGYISKGGLHVIGTRPMFEDSDEENLGHDIKAKFLEVFGFYPILKVSETLTIQGEGDEFDFEPINLRDYRAFLDTEKLDEITSFNLSYVQSLFETIIKHRMADPLTRQVDTYSSKKYSFSDTPDWWEVMEVDENNLPGDREIVEVFVELG